MEKMPRVLLLGDSIRMSYQSLVAEKLKDLAVVVGPEDNCQFSSYTLSSIDRWVGLLGVPDIVHWNNGIHDAGHNPDRTPIQIPLDEYQVNLGLILKKLKDITPHVIWATSTPVHPDRPFRDDQWAWRNNEIDQYNLVATKLMKYKGIPINDLHSIVASDPDRYLADDQLHLSEEGVKKCAEAVADVIRKYIKANF
jgi:lysophospholipase L1-like esterase